MRILPVGSGAFDATIRTPIPSVGSFPAPPHNSPTPVSALQFNSIPKPFTQREHQMP